MRRPLSALVLCVLCSTSGVFAQQAAPATATITTLRPGEPAELGWLDTPEGRIQKFGFTEDPGLDPDPTRVFLREGKEFNIMKFVRRDSAWDVKPGWVRPYGYVNFEAELYRRDNEHVWVFVPVIKPVEEKIAPSLGANPSIEMTPALSAELSSLRPEFDVMAPPPAAATLRFRNSSTGLPDGGSWRNSLDIADMNKDGFLDIVAPPQRGGAADAPTIFLGDGKGNWRFWEAAQFDRGANYGSASVGDLNRDGNPDIVLGVHLHGMVAYLGDGKGKFTDSSDGLPNEFPTRRAHLADMDNDGDLDIVALSEGPTMFQREKPDVGLLKVALNNGKGGPWRTVNIAEKPRQLGGDWLSVGDFNGDGRTDLYGSSIVMSGTDVAYLGEKGGQFTPFGRGFLPFYSNYQASTAGKFTARKRDDLIVSFVRAWPTDVDTNLFAHPENLFITGIDRITWEGKEARRVPVMRYSSGKPIWGMSSADFDGDGNLDFVFSRVDPREFVFMLGDGRGGFRQAKVEGLEVPANISYDLLARDVNGDGRADLVVMFESSEAMRSRKDGSIRVWLNESASGR